MDGQQREINVVSVNEAEQEDLVRRFMNTWRSLGPADSVQVKPLPGESLRHLTQLMNWLIARRNIGGIVRKSTADGCVYVMPKRPINARPTEVRDVA